MLVNKFETLPRTRAEAVKRGNNKYLTGKSCVNGHIAERYTASSTCVTCMRVRSRVDIAVNKTRQRIEDLKAPADFEESW